MKENRTEIIKLHGREISLTLSQSYYKSKFPTWLKDISSEWYTVLKGDERYIGEVYCVEGVWRVFNTSVITCNGTFIGALETAYKAD